jgi:hypothetical protein
MTELQELQLFTMDSEKTLEASGEGSNMIRIMP